MIVLIGSSAAMGQESVGWDPGEVATTGIEVPALLAGPDRAVSWRILPDEVGRLLGPSTGRLSWHDDEDAILPVSVALDPDLAAGDTRIARVVIIAADGRSDTIAAHVRVRARRRFELEVTAMGRATIGRSLDVGYRVVNRGNAPDTALILATPIQNLLVADLPPAHTLEQGQSVEGVLRFEVDPEAIVGTAATARLAVEGGATSHVELSTVVREPEGLLPGLVRVPTSIFLGTTIRNPTGTSSVANPVFAIRGRGLVAGQAEIEYALRSIPDEGMSFAFRGDPYGPRVFGALRTPGLQVSAGELTVRSTSFTGLVQNGMGGRLIAGRGAWSGSAFAAAPMTAGKIVDGHIGAARIDRRLAAATIGARFEDADRGSLFDPAAGSRVSSALATFEWTGSPQHVASVEAGWMRVRDVSSSEEASGPAIQALYAYRGSMHSLDLRARTLPGIARDSRLPGREVRASGYLGMTHGLGLLGGFYLESDPNLGQTTRSERRGGEVGGRFIDGSMSVDLLGRIRHWEDLDPRTYTTVVSNLALRMGRVSIDGSLELGVADFEGAREPVRQMRIGGQWFRGDGWIRAGLRHARDPLTGSWTRFELGARQQPWRRVSFIANAAVPLDTPDWYRDLLVQVGAEFRVLHRTAIMIGAESNQLVSSSGGSSWKLSLGVRQELDLAMPIEKPAPLSGIVFVDLDGNGVRTPTEPLAEGVTVRSGVEEAVTDASGRFRFVTRGARHSVTVDPTSLESGMLPPDVPIVPTAAHIGVPIVPATALEIELFLDEDGDGIRDPGENVLPAAALTLTNAPGAAWALQTDGNGATAIRSLRPGEHTIEVSPESLPWRAVPPEATAVRLVGGESRTVRIPVRTKTVRFRALADPESGVPVKDGSDR